MKLPYVNKKEAIRYSLAVLFLFVLFFSPPIIKSINIVWLLCLGSAIYLFIQYRKTPAELWLLIKDAKLHIALTLLGAVFALTLTSILVSYGTGVALDNPRPYAVTIYRLGLIAFVLATCVSAFLSYAKKQSWELTTVIALIIGAFALQALIGVVAFIFPFVKDFFISVMATNTGNIVFENKFEISRRFYGFANTLLDPYGYALGIAAAIPILLTYMSKRLGWLLVTPFLLFMAVINSRTGLVIFAIIISVIVLASATYIVRNKTFKTWSVEKISVKSIVGVTVSLAVASVSVFFIINSNILAVRSTVSSIRGYSSYIISGSNSDSAHAPLFESQLWYLPADTKTLYIGAGHDMLNPQEGHKRTDPGYVNDIFAFGLLGSIVLYAAVLSSSWLLLVNRQASATLRLMGLAIIFTFLVYNLKGLAVSANQGLILVLLLSASATLLPLRSIEARHE